MAIIPQLRLFGWNEIEPLCDLERLRLVLEYMPEDEKEVFGRYCFSFHHAYEN